MVLIFVWLLAAHIRNSCTLEKIICILTLYPATLRTHLVSYVGFLGFCL